MSMEAFWGAFIGMLVYDFLKVLWHVKRSDDAEQDAASCIGTQEEGDGE